MRNLSKILNATLAIKSVIDPWRFAQKTNRWMARGFKFAAWTLLEASDEGVLICYQ